VPLSSSLTTWPVRLLQYTPFHRQQSSPFHDERMLAGSDRPALKARRAELSPAKQLVTVTGQSTPHQQHTCRKQLYHAAQRVQMS
jgi:hypothetical protein